MNDNKHVPDGYCGLYCAACPEYRDNLCFGCKSDELKPGWCQTCGLKKCAREKGLEFCYECNNYPCTELDQFKTDKSYPYHTEVYSYMETIKNKGYSFWLKQMEERWSCPECKNALVWWDTECPECGVKVNGYEKPGNKNG